MVIEKSNKSLRKKLLEKDENDNYRHCSICSKTITPEDIQNNNFEYVKSKLRREFCTQYMYK